MEILEGSIRHTGERQEVALMWKDENCILQDNRLGALRQMDRLDIQFKNDPSFATKYDKNFQEYIRLGFIVLLSLEDRGTLKRVS